MRKATVLLVACLFAVLVTAPLFAAGTAASATWTGWITDSHCGAKGANAQHTKDCAAKCAKDGGKVVFFNNADKKLYDLDKTDLALEHVGHEVSVTGKLAGNKIAVEKIEAHKAM
jgi:hypothetical protein